MRLDSKHRDVPRVGPVSPEDSSCSGRVVLEIGLKNLEAVLAAQVADFMETGGQATFSFIFKKAFRPRYSHILAKPRFAKSAKFSSHLCIA